MATPVAEGAAATLLGMGTLTEADVTPDVTNQVGGVVVATLAPVAVVAVCPQEAPVAGVAVSPLAAGLAVAGL